MGNDTQQGARTEVSLLCFMGTTYSILDQYIVVGGIRKSDEGRNSTDCAKFKVVTAKIVIIVNIVGYKVI